MEATLIIVLVLVVLVILYVARSIRVVPQHTVEIVERLGRYHRTLQPGLNLIVPSVDRSRARIDVREQRLELQPLPAVTADNQELAIPVTIFHQVTDPRQATYEIENYAAGLEQLTMTVLRNVIGGLRSEDALTSHGHVTATIQDALAEAASGWGIQLNRVELGPFKRPGIDR